MSGGDQRRPASGGRAVNHAGWCLRRFLAAASCTAACALAMAADSAWVGDPGATYLGAFIFVPLGMSAIFALAFAAELIILAVAAIRQHGVRYAIAEWPLRVVAGRPRHDDARIAELERGTGSIPVSPLPARVSSLPETAGELERLLSDDEQLAAIIRDGGADDLAIVVRKIVKQKLAPASCGLTFVSPPYRDAMAYWNAEAEGPHEHH
jgi:hypothetical protein